jgi:hypothetical protein
LKERIEIVPENPHEFAGWFARAQTRSSDLTFDVTHSATQQRRCFLFG